MDLNETLKKIGNEAASEIAANMSLTDIADSGDAPSVSLDMADYVISELEEFYPDASESEDYDDFRNDIADAILEAASNAVYRVLHPFTDSPGKEDFGDAVYNVLKTHLSVHDIELEKEEEEDDFEEELEE